MTQPGTTADVRLRSIPAMVRASARRFGPREAIVDDGRRISYADLDMALMASARAAMSAGIGPGDRVAIWAPNSAEYIVAVLGVLSAGAWIVPMNTRMSVKLSASRR